MESIIIGIAITIVLPLVYGVFYYLKEKEEKKISYDSEFTIKMSKGILLFFLIWMILYFLGMIAGVVLVLVLEEPNETQLFWIIEGICVAFFLLGAVGFFDSKYSYFVVTNDEIIVKRIFRKPFIIHYSDITYINGSPFALRGGMSCLDCDGIPLLSIDRYYVGLEKLAIIFKEKGCKALPDPYPSEDMKKNPKFIRYRKQDSLKFGFWCSLIVGIFLIGCGFIVHSLSDFQKYENEEISGIVESYTVGDVTLQIKLENDSREYYINNIVYDELNKNIYNVMCQGDFIRLHIAYVDEYERYNISQIEVDDVVYLDMATAEKNEYFNYQIGMITSYVMFGIGGLLIVLSVVNFIRLKKIK